MNFDYLEKFLENTLFSPSDIPIKEGVPFLMPNADQSFESLVLSCSYYIKKEKERLAILKDRANDLTRRKVEKHIEARTKQLGRLKKILGSFYKESVRPGASAFNPYEELIFRDWCWNTKELEEYQNYLSPQRAKSDHLFLGAGACGLSYNFAKNSAHANIIASDINPFLILSSQKIISGKSLKMHDTPHFPDSFENMAKTFDVSPKVRLENHHQVFADFSSLPFKESCFDHINATWFLDVIKPDLSDSIKNVLYYLNEEGALTYIGPSNFHKDDLSDSYLLEEILQVFKQYFNSVTHEIRPIFYLDSGYNSQRRLEQVLFITADGPKKEFAKKLTSTPASKFRVDENLKFKIAESHTLSQILRHVHGDMSYEDLAKKIQEEFGFGFNQALAYARAVIEKIQS